MNNEMITVIIKALVAVLSVLITSVVIPYIKGKIGENKYNEIKYYIEYAVRCAEQLYSKEESEQKKQYVVSYVTRKVNEIGIEMSEEDISVLIEATVNYIKYGMEYTR